MTLTTMRLTEITASQNEVALSYHNDKVRGLYFLAVVFVATIIIVAHYEYKFVNPRFYKPDGLIKVLMSATSTNR